MVDRPQPKFFHKQQVKVRVLVPLQHAVVAIGTIFGLEWRSASRLGQSMEWHYYVAFSPTGPGVLVSESELVMGMA